MLIRVQDIMHGVRKKLLNIYVAHMADAIKQSE